ncbi:glycosyltransferase WbuB [Mycolicibacterium moriokaense]|nr:glycosyltransferase WbuB [Mycolicibacterium moriokaense]
MKALAGKHAVLIVENEAVPFDRRMWNISKALREFGSDVSVICPMYGKDTERAICIDGISIRRYKNTFANGSVASYLREYTTAIVKTLALLHRVLLQSKRVDIVHVANPPDIFWPLALYLRLYGIRFIFDEHDLAPEAYLSRFDRTERSGGVLFTAQKLFQRLSYRFSDAIISTNESYRSRALEIDPKNALKTFVVRNGPDTREFSTRPSNAELRKGYKYMAAYIGVMAVQDGVEYIIRAVDELVNRRDFRDILVYLIGSGDDWLRLKQLTEELRLDDFIVLTGRVPDECALEILSTADICLSPDPSSPLNDLSTMTKIMEYMALGKPIVSFDLKEARFSAGDSALYVKNNDAVAFADGILKLLGDPDGCRKMSGVGRARVDSMLSWQKQSVNLLNAYQFVLSKKPGRS